MTTRATTQTPFRMNFRPMETPTTTPYRTNHRPPERRASSGGKVLFFVVACVAFTSVCGAAAFAYTTPKFICSFPGSDAKNTLKALHAVAEAWRANHAGRCPTPEQLKDEKELAASIDIHDAWAEPYEIRCDDESTTVISSGPDRKRGTADDITVPARAVSGPDFGTWDGR